LISQVSLGLATLLYTVPVHLGSAHQAGALTLFSIAVFCLHSVRVPAAAVASLRTGGAPAARAAAAAAKQTGGAAFAGG
jgi:heme A synthase